MKSEDLIIGPNFLVFESLDLIINGVIITPSYSAKPGHFLKYIFYFYMLLSSIIILLTSTICWKQKIP